MLLNVFSCIQHSINLLYCVLFCAYYHSRFYFETSVKVCKVIGFFFKSMHQFLKTFLLQACKILGTVSIVFFNSHTAPGRHSHKIICFTTSNFVLIIFYLAVIMFGILIFKCVCNCSSRRILGKPHHQISLFLFFRKPSEQTIQSLNRMKTFSLV